MRNRLRFMWRQMNVQLQVRVLSGGALILLLVQPVIFSGIGFVLARMAGRETPDLIYTVLGGGIMGLWSGMLFNSFFDITRDRVEGTLELIVGSPTSLNTILGARVLTNVLTGSVSLLGAFLIAVAGFRFFPSAESLPALIVSMGIVLFTFWCLGVFLANFHAWSRVGGTFINYIEMPVAVLSGFMFPVRILPVWMLSASTLLPLRWAIAALNAALGEAASPSSVWEDWLLALGLSLAYLLLARWLAYKVHDQIRVSGELSSI